MKKLWFLVLLPILFSLNGCSDDDSNNSEPDKGEYSLRDIGPAGGFIFYINPNYKKDGWRYLEAAPSDQGALAWGTDGIDIEGADGIEVGTGLKNTLDIIKGDPSDNTAAGICANYSIVRNNVTYDDWFLPSKDELELIFVNLRQVNVGNWPKDELGEYFAYWTSSESGPNTAWGKCFQTLVTMGGEKYYPLSIRPIRAF